MCSLWTSDGWSVLDPMSQWWATPLCQGGVSLGCRCQKMQMFLLSALAQCEVRCSILGWKGSGRSWSPTPPFYLWEHLSSWKLAGILMEWWNQNAITSLPSCKVCCFKCTWHWVQYENWGWEQESFELSSRLPQRIQEEKKLHRNISKNN